VARGAYEHGLPTVLSTYATNSIEEAGAVAGENLWFQLYPLADEDIEADLFKRFTAVGGEVLVVTIDIPGPTRRERDIANGLAVPPQRDWRTWLAGAMRPRWAIETLRAGFPVFKNVERYASAGGGGGDMTALAFLTSISGGHVSPERLRRYREQWPGKLVVKGVLSLEDAWICAECGADGIVVSNHGGRQLDAAPTAVEVLPSIRQAVGGQMAILADGGVRSGLDIARLLALGADFVLLGRAMTFSLGAMGPAGPAHALKILKEELLSTLGQVGCSDHRELARFLQE
jgi:L-lactate dehydrogenase (cytochrome)